MQATEKIWRNGSFVSWEDANVHILTHALHYGTGVFEGIRAYDTPKGSAVFRLTDHLERLRRSAALYQMDLGYSVPELAAAVHDTVGANGVPSCYIRPIVFRGAGPMGLYPGDNPARYELVKVYEGRNIRVLPYVLYRIHWEVDDPTLAPPPEDAPEAPAPPPPDQPALTPRAPSPPPAPFP